MDFRTRLDSRFDACVLFGTATHLEVWIFDGRLGHWNGEKQNDEADPSFRASAGPGTRPRCSRTEATSHFVDHKNAMMVGGAVSQEKHAAFVSTVYDDA